MYTLPLLHNSTASKFVLKHWLVVYKKSMDFAITYLDLLTLWTATSTPAFSQVLVNTLAKN